MKTELNKKFEEAINQLNTYKDLKEKQKQTEDKAREFFNIVTDIANIFPLVRLSDRIKIRTTLLNLMIQAIDVSKKVDGFRDELEKMKEYSA